MMITVAVSGRAYDAGLDPHTTDVPRQEGWPEPTRRRWGRGWEYQYEVTVDQAEAMEDHLRTLGESLGYASDPDDRAEGRLVRLAARRIRRTLDVRRT